MPERVLIAGCGDVGTALGQLLVARGDRVWGIRREISALPKTIQPLAGDLTSEDGFPDLPADLDLVIYAAAAGRSDAEHYRAVYVEGLRRLLNRLERQEQHPRRLLFTSSTGVYAQNEGEAVDETSATRPRGFRGELMLEAEKVLLSAPWPGVILRLGGIYGPGRTRLIQRALSGEPWQRTPPLYTNRIHRDDAARAIDHLLQFNTPETIYVGVDQQSVPLDEVMSWICQQRGKEVPDGDAGKGARGSGKRISSARLIQTGFEFKYPSYREGYREIIAAYRDELGV